MKLNTHTHKKKISSRLLKSELEILQNLFCALNDLPEKYQDEKWKMYRMNIKIIINNLKQELYGSQTELSISYLKKVDSS